MRQNRIFAFERCTIPFILADIVGQKNELIECNVRMHVIFAFLSIVTVTMTGAKNQFSLSNPILIYWTRLRQYSSFFHILPIYQFITHFECFNAFFSAASLSCLLTQHSIYVSLFIFKVLRNKVSATLTQRCTEKFCWQIEAKRTKKHFCWFLFRRRSTFNKIYHIQYSKIFFGNKVWLVRQRIAVHSIMCMAQQQMLLLKHTCHTHFFRQIKMF